MSASPAPDLTRQVTWTRGFENTLRETQHMKTFYDRVIPVDVDNILERLVKVLQKLPDRISNPDDSPFDDTDVGALNCLLAQYINEIWISEIPTNTTFETEELVIRLLEGDAHITGYLEAQGVQNAPRVALKIRNLVFAARKLFDVTTLGRGVSQHLETNFSPQLASDIHAMIGKDLFDHAGRLRTKMVTAAQSTIVYANPKTIEGLDALFAFTNSRVNILRTEYVDNDIERTRGFLLLGTVFFSEFLRIHPFLNGNGRTARLLLSVLLQEVTILPFSLYVASDPRLKAREVYINALEQRNEGYAPSVLATMVLISAHQTASSLNYLLE
ncbi:hypothetical protein HKX48_004954 [Thoreauomyces humboldtii]|nr:hypothetical protein HKX48_004954 [Thoreauomyces humboldtii]